MKTTTAHEHKHCFHCGKLFARDPKRRPLKVFCSTRCQLASYHKMHPRMRLSTSPEKADKDG